MFDCIKAGKVYPTADGYVFGRRPRGCDSPPVPIRCGKCAPCILAKGREIALRGVHETKLQPPGFSHFPTLTYSDDNLPEGAALVPRHPTLFLKRLRKALPGRVVRYMLRAEYGGRFGRPHYHLILWGFPVPDLKLYSGSPRAGDAVYTSDWMESLWGLGAVRIGSVSPASVQYVAGYLNKLDDAAAHSDLGKSYAHAVVDKLTGEIVPRPAPYNRYSTRPGIGAGFLEKFGREIWESGHCILDSQRAPVPAYYSRILKREDPALFERVRAKRVAAANTPEARARTTPARRKARAAITMARFRLGRRGEGIK